MGKEKLSNTRTKTTYPSYGGGFSCEQYLNRHLIYHNSTKEFICDVCGKVLPGLDILKKHKKKAHTPKVPQQCSYCGKWYSSHWTVRRHVLNMHLLANQEHRCEICGFVSSTRRAKKQHIQFKHNPEKKHKCTMCDKAFKTPTLLKEHTAIHTGVDLYSCAYCEATFKSKSNRYTHYKRHHPTEYSPDMTRRTRPTAIPNYDIDFAMPSSSSNNEPSQTFSCEPYLTRHLVYHNPKKEFICDVCGKVVPGLDILKKHKKKAHTPKVPQQCIYCDKWYSSQWTLQKHVLNMHELADQEHICEICGFVSSTRQAKKQHIQFKHNPEKKHKCTVCDKAFKTPSMLKEHMATHTGVDLYNCAYCEATFKSKSNRSTHYKRHHPVEYNPNMTRRARPTAIPNYESI